MRAKSRPCGSHRNRPVSRSRSCACWRGGIPVPSANARPPLNVNYLPVRSLNRRPGRSTAAQQPTSPALGRCTVPCGCKLEDLLAILHDRAPAKADTVALQRRRVEHGLLSVGLKLHALGDGRQFFSLVERLGGAFRVLESNVYKHSQASLCLVLPPVGNARAAILLLECIEQFIGSALFGNRKIQIQVCSPGRFSLRRSALLAIGFYLGSDTLRRYAFGDLETTVSRDHRYQRGQRLVIYDAEGDFDRGFEWWERVGNGKDRLVRRQLPFENGRTDLLTGNGSRLDIKNINLLATLLTHAEYQGYWNELGKQFEEMLSLLDQHLLAGLVSAPWVRSEDAESLDDTKFFSALQELVAYVFQESARLKTTSGNLFAKWHELPARSSSGILYEMQSLLTKYRTEVIRQSCMHEHGDRT